MKMFIVKANNSVRVFDNQESARSSLRDMCFHKQWCTANWSGHSFSGHSFICQCGLIEEGSITEVNLNEEF